MPCSFTSKPLLKKPSGRGAEVDDVSQNPEKLSIEGTQHKDALTVFGFTKALKYARSKEPVERGRQPRSSLRRLWVPTGPPRAPNPSPTCEV